MPILKVYDESTQSWVGISSVQGETGAAAGFGTPIISVDSTTGTPSATISASGADTSKVFSFAFSGLKGEKGDTATEFYYGISEPSDPDIKFWMNPAGMNMVHEVPPYGAPGQILAKTSSDSYLIDWIDIPTISTSDIDTIMEG